MSIVVNAEMQRGQPKNWSGAGAGSDAGAFS